MWEVDYKESWPPKNWCFWTAVMEKTLKSPLDCKEIRPINPKGNQSWIFIWRTDTEAETPVLCHLMQRTDSLEKPLMLRKIEGRRRRGMTEGEWQRMRWLDGITDYGHEFEQALGVGDGQGGLVCCSPWGCKESDMTEWLNRTEKTLESSLDCKEIQPVYPKGDQSWEFIWRSDADTETPVLWPPDAKSWLIGKDPDVGKD